MSKRTIWVVVALGALLAVPALAEATGGSPATSHTVKLHGLRDGLWTNGQVHNVCLPQDKIIVIGTASGTIGGTATGQGTFYEKGTCHKLDLAQGHGAYLFPNGSITFQFRWVKNPPPPTPYVVKDTVTGGTGAYQGASGTLTVTGHPTNKGDADNSTNNVTGILKF
jgi:hypothetical protein